MRKAASTSDLMPTTTSSAVTPLVKATLFRAMASRVSGYPVGLRGSNQGQHDYWQLHRHRRHRYAGDTQYRQRHRPHGERPREHHWWKYRSRTQYYLRQPVIRVRLEGSNHNTISGNYIGVGASGNSALGNSGNAGIQVSGTDTTIGPNNTIAHNSGDGVEVNAATTIRNKITQNSIYANGGLGINLRETRMATLPRHHRFSHARICEYRWHSLCRLHRGGFRKP